MICRIVDLFKAVNRLVHTAFGNVFVIAFFKQGYNQTTILRSLQVNLKEKFDKNLPLVKAGCDHLSPFRLYSGWKN